MKEKIIAALKNVFDPEIPVNIWDMGLVYNIEIDSFGIVELRMTMTSPTCPASEQIMESAKKEISKVPGVSAVKIELVWEPAWNLSMLSESARIELDMV